MAEKSRALTDIAEYLPEIMRKLLGGQLIVSKAWELTIPQLRALSITANHPGCTMGELAGGLGIRINAATGLADRLIQQGLLAREGDPTDRRLVRLRLTEPGRRAREACRREWRRRVDEALQRLSPDEQDRIAAALVLLHRALEVPKPSIGPSKKGMRSE